MIILLSIITMCLCLLLQIVTGTQAVRYFNASRHSLQGMRSRTAIFIRLCVLMVLLMAGIVLQMALWALLYRFLGGFSTFEEAFYFSGVTFTSLGYGDLVLKPPIRLLAPIEAASGLTMFSVVTVILIGALREWNPQSVEHPDRTTEAKETKA